jgi:hypothetical protein
LSISEEHQIDFVSIHQSKEVVLTVSDHLAWDDVSGHLVLLQAKLNAYLRFVESGELYQRFPDAAALPVVIQVVGKFPPDDQGSRFLQLASRAVEAAGFELRHSLLQPH